MEVAYNPTDAFVVLSEHSAVVKPFSSKLMDQYALERAIGKAEAALARLMPLITPNSNRGGGRTRSIRVMRRDQAELLKTRIATLRGALASLPHYLPLLPGDVKVVSHRHRRRASSVWD